MTGTTPYPKGHETGVRILDGLVVIADEPFTDVMLQGSTFRRWSDEEIARYHRDLRRWERWGWLSAIWPRLGRWLKVPRSRPADRLRTITGCRFEGGSR